jgi:hypothetical protein
MRNVMPTIVYRPGQKRRPLRKKKPSPEVATRIVTAYGLQRLARIRRYERTVAAQTGIEPEAPR